MKLKILSLSFALVACSVYPQSGDKPVYKSDAYSIYPNRVVQGSDISRIVSPQEIHSNYRGKEFSWRQKNDTQQYPTYTSNNPVSETLYNLSVDEMINLIEADGTWRTGESWGGVWTRDISYSILLSVSYMRPDISMNSLMKKVKDGRIIQDTGTGGSYPVSTDRAVWSVAAWQIYLVTGDKEWLKMTYEIIKNTIGQDEQIAYDEVTGMVKGESSFLDWREETYPWWMQPADIYESECLGTNAVHYQTNEIAAKMASLLDDAENKTRFENNARRIKDGINKHLWMDDKGYYAQYLYGRQHKIVSPRSETLGEALCILFDIADEERARRIVSSVSQTAYGNSCIFPQIPNIDPYHNNGIWPFVQSYWMWASAKVGNQTSVVESIAAIYRAAALFATNKENFIAQNGDYHTDTNSSNMLWSIAGNLSIVHRLFFGINFTMEGLTFQPFIPEQFGGEQTLTNFKYRNAVLDISVKGYGNKIASFTINGKKTKVLISPKLKGRHKVEIVMTNSLITDATITKTTNYFSVETPKVYLDVSNRLAWTQIPNATHYRILRNGNEIARQERRTINDNRYNIPTPSLYAEYQVIAEDANGVQGFASEPLSVYDLGHERVFDMTDFAPKTSFKDCKRYTGNGAVEISSAENTKIDMRVSVPTVGKYVIDFRYVNGSSTILSDNRCAIRTLSVNGRKNGIIVFAQQGKDIWWNWGYTNSVVVELKQGENIVTLSFEDYNVNMNDKGINRAMIDCMRMVRMD